jgi:arginase family enzyme
VVPWVDGAPARDPEEALDAVAERVDAVYLHVDLDALDPGTAPGVVDEPAPGGLSLGQAEDIVRGTCARFDVLAATIATFVPAHDVGDSTLGAAVRLARSLS